MYLGFISMPFQLQFCMVSYFFFYCVLTKFAEFDYVSSDLKLMRILGVSGSSPES